MGRGATDLSRTSARRLLLCALLACCGLLLLSAGRAAAEPIVALNAEWANLNGGEEEPSWEVMEQSGASTLRWQFDWFTKVEEGGWGPSYDRYVEKAAKHGITLMGMLYARKNNSPQFYTAAEAGPWLSEFVEPAVTRYGESGTFWAEHPGIPYHPITVWEVWNEPNLAQNNPGGVVNPGAYREFLKVTSNAIRNAANSRQSPNNAKVLFGGIYQGGSAEESVTYFNSVAKGFGLTPYFDGVGIHPYTFGGEKATEASRLAGFKEKVEAIRKAVSALCAECAAKESLWVTEIGWPTAGVVKPVSEPEQAKLLASSFNWMRIESAALNLQMMAWYDYKDAAGSAWPEKCGLRRSDGTYRESWWAFTVQTGHFAPGAGSVQMRLEPSGEVWATETLGGVWVKETPPGETAISAGGGGTQMLLDGGGQVWATSSVGSSWVQETGPGHIKISAGSLGHQMLLDAAGQVWATTAIGGGWAKGTPPGETAISAGWGGLEMLLDGGGQVWARNSVLGGWTLETWPANQQISAGGEIQMLLDAAGQVWATSGAIGGAWTQETPAGETAIDAGGGGLQMLLDGAGQVWATTGVGGAWVQESGPGQKAISAGSNGLQMRLDSKGQVWVKASIGWGGWALVSTPGVVAIAAG